MTTYQSGGKTIQIAEAKPSGRGPHPALLLLHGAGGNLSYWLDRIGGGLAQFGTATFAPHYFERTGTLRADAATILDGRHFALWLEAARDAITYVAAQPEVDARRIAVLGISLGGYLAMALGVEDSRLAAVVELSGGMPESWGGRVHAGMPPTLILHGDADPIVLLSEAHRAAALLKQAGVRHEIAILAGQGHWFSGASQMHIMLTLGQFLARYLQPPRP